MTTLRRWLPEWMSPAAPVVFVIAFLALYALPLVVSLDIYTHGIITQTFILASAALAWNWLGGYVGQVSFGHGAMFGVGGFVAARLLQVLPFWMAWAVAGIVAGLFALTWGHPTLRIRGPYFAIATIGVSEATRLIATFWIGFTGGASGISLPLDVGVTKQSLYWYALYFFAVVVALAYYLRKSRIGLGLLAIKEDVDAAGDVGVSATFSQDLVLLLSGTVVGVAGAIYASFFLFIEPNDMFGFERSISFLLMGVIGGIGTILGPALGAVVYLILQEYLIASYPELYLGLYGLLLVVVILFEPLGFSGLLLRIVRLLGYKPKARVAAEGMNSSAQIASGEESAGISSPGIGADQPQTREGVDQSAPS